MGNKSGFAQFVEHFGLKPGQEQAERAEKVEDVPARTGGSSGWAQFKKAYGLSAPSSMSGTPPAGSITTPEEQEKMRQDAVAQVGAFAGELVSNAGKVSAENKPMLDYQEYLKQTGQEVDTSKLVKGSAEYNAFLDGFYRWQGDKYLADASASTDNKMSYWANRMNFSDFESKSKYAPKVQSFYDEDSYYKNYLSMPEAERKPIWDTEISFADALYESVNGNYLMFIKLNNDERLFKDPLRQKLKWDRNSATSSTLHLDAEERQIFNYIFETEGVDKAIEFLNDMHDTLDARYDQYFIKKQQEWAKEDPFGNSLATVVSSPFRAALGAVGTVADLIGDGELEKDAWYSQLNRDVAVTRGAIGDQIRDSWAGDVGGFLYDAGMSMGDSVMNTVTMGGFGLTGKAAQWGSSILSGSNAAVTTMDDALARGLSSGQALTLGLISGVGEATAEKISLGTILDKKVLSGSALKQMFKSAGVEGLEEVSTELLNTVADVIISQDKSHWQMAIDAYKEQGLDENAAFWRAVGDKAVELGYNFLAGATAGGMMSGGNLVMNAGQVRQSAQTRKLLGKYLNEGVLDGTLTSEQIQGMVNEGLALGEGSGSYALAEKIQKDLNKGKMPKGETLAQLVAQSYTDADGKEGAKPVSIPQIDTKQQAGSNPASGVNVRQGSPVAAVGENAAADMVAPEAMDADGGLVPGAVHMKPQQAAVQYTFDEVYQAAKQAKDSGALSESRYEQVMEALGYLQNDMADGNLTEESYQATLAQVMDMVRPGGAQTEHRAEAEGLTTNVPDETWQTGQELAKALGRDIIFYRGSEGENGKYSDGKIYVNLNASDPVAQVIAHELTHSIEGTKHYDRLKRFVLTELARQNVDIAQARNAKYDQYKSQGVVLDSDAKIDAEIVAEFVQNRLLTSEVDIRALVQAEPGIAKRFWDKIRNWGKRMVGSADSRTVARLEHMEGLYRKAFAESNKGGFTPGSVAVQDGAVAQAQTDSVTEQRRQTEEAYARGELSDEDYDAAMDEFDRAEEERIGRSGEKFSFAGENANNADLDALEKAKKMQADGIANETIRQQTGWFQGMDSKWRFEIDDSEIQISDDIPNYTTLGDLLHHPKLYRAYPDMRHIDVVFQDLGSGTYGSYNPQFDSISLNYSQKNRPEAIKDALIHEIQHAIQHREIFTKGASPQNWNRKIEQGFDSRRKEDIRKAKEVDAELRRIQEEEPEFYRDMVELDAIAPNLPRGKIDWDTLEKIEDDPIEWQRYDAQREKLEAKYGETKVWDFIDLLYHRDQAFKNMGRTGVELYYNTAGEIEARNAENRREFSNEKRKSSPPDLGNEDTVFADDGGISAAYIGDTKDGRRCYQSGYDASISMDERLAMFKARIATIFNLGAVELKTDVKKIRVRGDKFTFQKNIYGDHLSQTGEQAAKVNSLYDLADILATAKYDSTATTKEPSYANPKMKPKNKAHKDVKYWYKFRNEIVFDGVPYTVTFNIRDKGGEQYQYLIDFKENKTPGLSNTAVKNLLRADQMSYGDSVAPINNSVKEQFSLSSPKVKEQGRPLEGWYDSDEKQLQAKKAGYPVLKGEQVVPYATWVRSEERGNYGLVTGKTDDGRLLVSFHNKHDGSMARDVALHPDMLTPVEGAYQMTKEEFASLMENEPLEVSEQAYTAEEVRELEELFRRSGGEENGTAQPIDMDKLPRKAQKFLNRAKRRMLSSVRKALGVSKFSDNQQIQEAVEQMCREYLTEGRISPETVEQIFQQAYENGIMINREMLDQFQDVRDQLRGTAVTLSDTDKSNIPDFGDFRKRNAFRLRIVDKGGMPVDSFYISLNDMAPALFPESITHPADQLVRMAEVAQSLAISKQSLDEYHGPERESFKAWARNDFECAASELMNDLYTIRRYAEDRSAEKAKPEVPKTAEEAMEVYRKLKKARRQADKATAKNLLTEHDQMQVGRLLRHEIELQHLDPDTDNVEGITAIYEAKREYEELSGLIAGYKQSLHSKLRQDADMLLETANTWKDKKAGILYARETMERNVFDIVKDRQLAQEIVDAYFTPVHKAEAAATRMKNEYRNRIRALNLSRKATDGNLVSEAHAVQLLGEAEDNIRLLENARGRIEMRDGKTLEEWRAVVAKLWAENPKLDKAKIRDAVSKMRDIYDELFVQMNRVRVANGYEPINYRSGYFPHFQPGESDGVLAMFGRALGIDTQVVALPTTINGLTHTFKPGMQWFGNAQERLGFNTAYDAVEGFDKYIEGAAGVIHQTENIQRLRALATQIRYRTSEDGLKEQVDAVWADDRLTDEEKQIKIADIYANGKYTLGNFVAELDEYTNLLANKKSKYDRSIEALMGRRCYTLMKWLESRVGANMIAGNVSSALTNFIPLTQAGARLDKRALMKGMWQTLKAMKTDDGMVGESTFLTNRRGSDPLVQTWGQKASSKVGWLMEHIDQFVSGSVVRGAYYHNTKRGMSHQEAVNQADSFAAGVMADRSKGAMPTLFQSSNPIYKLFTQFQLEVNNQFSEVFKDLPRSVKGRGVMALSKVLFQYFIGAWLFNELFEKLFGRRPALDPIDLLLGLGKDMFDEDVGFGEGISNFGKNALGELPFSSGLTLFGMETDGGRFPVSSAIPNVPKMWEAVTEKDWSGKKRFDTFIGEAQKPLTYLALPFGGNQAAKIYKGMEALIRGGSYSVDKDGNDILQYPVYNDTFGDTVLSALRALIMGKSSLPEAQDWVENGFDSLGAKETSVYKAMLEAGVQDREAFGLIQELGSAKKSGDKSREAVQREILMKADAPEEAKALAYFGLLASDSGKALMMELGKMEANLWEVSKVLISNSDANKLTGAEASCAKRDAIANAALTDEEKVYLYEHLISESRVEDYKLFQDAGLDFGQFVEAHNQYARINGMDMDTKSKATAFSHWVENQGFTAKQEEVVRESFRYYMSMPVSAGRYEDLLEAGLTSEDAYELSERLDDLEPETGTDKVTDVQRWRACVEFSYKPGTQLAALAGVMDDAQLLKARVAYEMDVNPDTYVTLKERLPEYDLNHDGSMTNAEVKAAVDSMKGLSYKQKAVLWQLNVNSKSAKNNPYSTVVGQQVLDAKNEG